MKNKYHNPVIRLISLEMQAQLMQGSQSQGLSANFMSGPTVSETKGANNAPQYHDVWDDDWSQE